MSENTEIAFKIIESDTVMIDFLCFNCTKIDENQNIIALLSHLPRKYKR